MSRPAVTRGSRTPRTSRTSTTGATSPPESADELLSLSVPQLKAQITSASGVSTFNGARKAELQTTLALLLSIQLPPAPNPPSDAEQRARASTPVRAARAARYADGVEDEEEEEGDPPARRDDRARRERTSRQDVDDERRARRLEEVDALRRRLRRAGASLGRSESDSDTDSSADESLSEEEDDDGSADEEVRRPGSKRARVAFELEAKVALRQAIEDIQKKAKEARATFGALPITPAQKKYKVFDFNCVSELGLIADCALEQATTTDEPAERADSLERAVDRLAEGLRLMQQAMAIGVTDGWDRAVEYVARKEVLSAASAPASALLPADYKVRRKSTSPAKKSKKKKKRPRASDDDSESSDGGGQRPAKKKKAGGARPASKKKPATRPAKKKQPAAKQKKAKPPTKPQKAKKGKTPKLRNKAGETVHCWAVTDKKGTVCNGNHYKFDCPHAYSSDSDGSASSSSESD